MEPVIIQSGAGQIGYLLGLGIAVYLWYEAGSWVWNKVKTYRA